MSKICNIHHLNENRLDNRLINLSYLFRSKHTSIHNKGNTNWLGRSHSEETKLKIREYNLGKVLSQETKQKISQSCKGNKNRLRNVC